MATARKITYPNLVQCICALLVLLWSYTLASKLMDLTDFKRQMFAQSFSHGFANLLVWAVPITELMVLMLLVFKPTRYKGLLSSFSLLSLFTAYIMLVLLGFYKHVPCSCGGVLKQLGWQNHLWFNLFFMVLNGLALYWHGHGIKGNTKSLRPSHGLP